MSVAAEASHVLEQLLADFKGKFASSNHQQSALDAFRAFSAAVDWQVRQLDAVYQLQPCSKIPVDVLQEPWLIAALCAQTLLFFSVLVMHKNTTFLTGVFVFASEHLEC